MHAGVSPDPQGTVVLMSMMRILSLDYPNTANNVLQFYRELYAELFHQACKRKHKLEEVQIAFYVYA